MPEVAETGWAERGRAAGTYGCDGVRSMLEEKLVQDAVALLAPGSHAGGGSDDVRGHGPG